MSSTTWNNFTSTYGRDWSTITITGSTQVPANDGGTVTTQTLSDGGRIVTTVDGKGTSGSVDVYDAQGELISSKPFGENVDQDPVSTYQLTLSSHLLAIQNNSTEEMLRHLMNIGYTSNGVRIAGVIEDKAILEEKTLTDLYLLMMQMLESVSKSASTSKKSESEHYMNKKIDANNEQLEALKEYQRKMEEAKKKGDLISALTIAGAALTIAVALTMAVATGGTAAPMSAFMIAMAIDTIVGVETGKSGMGELTNLLTKELQKSGMTEQEAQIAAAVIIGVSTIILTAGLGAGAAMASNVDKGIKISIAIAGILEAGMATGEQAASIDLAYTKHDAEMSRIKSEEAKLKQELIQQLLWDVMMHLEKIIKDKMERIEQQSDALKQKGDVDMAVTAKID